MYVDPFKSVIFVPGEGEGTHRKGITHGIVGVARCFVGHNLVYSTVVGLIAVLTYQAVNCFAEPVTDKVIAVVEATIAACGSCESAKVVVRENLGPCRVQHVADTLHLAGGEIGVRPVVHITCCGTGKAILLIIFAIDYKAVAQGH